MKTGYQILEQCKEESIPCFLWAGGAIYHILGGRLDYRKMSDLEFFLPRKSDKQIKQILLNKGNIMITSKIFKKPILIIGILFMFIFLAKHKDFFYKRFQKVQATSCRSAMVMLTKRAPKNWALECNDNNLRVIIKSKLLQENFKSEKLFKTALYRELANHLKFISSNSLNESLERTLMIRVSMKTRKPLSKYGKIPTLSLNRIPLSSL